MIQHPSRYNPNDIPSQYTMGTGHVKFFRNKLQWLASRHSAICMEMDRRGIRRDLTIVVDLSSIDPVVASVLCQSWRPSRDDHMTNIGRLTKRWENRKIVYKFNGQAIDDEKSFVSWLTLVETTYKL